MKIRGLSAAFFLTALIAIDAGVSGADSRLEPPKNLDAYFPWSPPTTKAAWETRARELREQMKVALGLWPEPPPRRCKAVMHGKIELDDYTVEKVYFESRAGFFVTGSLYRPKSGVGSVGRTAGALVCCVRTAIGRTAGFTTPAMQGRRSRSPRERRNSMPAAAVRCRRAVSQLARMGCVVFHYDMIGYADSKQIGSSWRTDSPSSDPK